MGRGGCHHVRIQSRLLCTRISQSLEKVQNSAKRKHQVIPWCLRATAPCVCCSLTAANVLALALFDSIFYLADLMVKLHGGQHAPDLAYLACRICAVGGSVEDDGLGAIRLRPASTAGMSVLAACKHSMCCVVNGAQHMPLAGCDTAVSQTDDKPLPGLGGRPDVELGWHLSSTCPTLVFSNSPPPVVTAMTRLGTGA
jgi:hypothetical protein